MARPREFDRDNTLRKAMCLFWRQGYAATSVQELGAALGLKPGSLYNAFHDKHCLYLEALDCYQQQEQTQIAVLLDGCQPAREAVRQLFLAVVERDLDDPDHKGCMMVNAAAERALHDPAVRARVAESRAALEQIFHDALLQAQQDGELAADKNPSAIAAFLVNSLFGLRITSKVLHEREALLKIVETTLQVLD